MNYLSAALLLLIALMPVNALSNGENLSPNMGLPVPTVGVTNAPAWAQDMNASLGILDAHNHCSGSGVQVPSCGIDINSALSFLNNDATNVNSVVFGTNSGSPSNTSIYSDGTDLYYNDANGTPIQITANGGVNVSAGNIQNLPSTPSGGAGISWQNAQGTFQLLKDSGTVGANLDAGTLIVRYIGSYPTPSGNYTQIRANASLATGYSFTLPATLPSATSALMSSSAGAMSYQTPNQLASSMTVTGADAIAGKISIAGADTIALSMDSTGANAIANEMNATGANAVANTRTRSTGASVGLGGVAYSSSSGGYSTASTSFTDVTNLSVTLTTNGRPVMVMLIPSTAGGVTSYVHYNGGGSTVGLLSFLRDSSQIQQFGMWAETDNVDSMWPPGGFSMVDVPSPSSTTHTYKVQVKSGSAARSLGISHCVLVAYEL